MADGDETTDGPRGTEPPAVLSYGTPDATSANSPVATAALVCSLSFLIVPPLACAIAGPRLLFLPFLLLPVIGLALGVRALNDPTLTPAPGRRRAKSAVWLGSAELLFLLAFALILPNMGRASERGNRVKCSSNLRQIGLGFQMYANDNQGQLPPDLMTILATQELTSAVFNCPSSSDVPAAGATPQQMLQDFQNPGRYSYVHAGFTGTALTATADHVLAYEHAANHDNRGMNVLYGDGHVQWLEKPAADHVVAELKAGHNPPRPMGKSQVGQ